MRSIGTGGVRDERPRALQSLLLGVESREHQRVRRRAWPRHRSATVSSIATPEALSSAP